MILRDTDGVTVITGLKISDRTIPFGHRYRDAALGGGVYFF